MLNQLLSRTTQTARSFGLVLLVAFGLFGPVGCARSNGWSPGSVPSTTPTAVPAVPQTSETTDELHITFPPFEPAVPWPRDPYPKGSDGARIRQALLPGFNGAKVQGPPATVVKLSNRRADELWASQLGYVKFADPTCRRWTQGLWAEAVGSADRDPDGILGVALMVDMSNGLFGKPMMSEAIVSTALDGADAPPPPQCRTTRVGDGQNLWNVRIEDVSLTRKVGESPWAYRIVDQSGDQPDLWTSVFRLRGHIVEVKMTFQPKTDDLAVQQALLEDLAAAAYTRAKAVLR
ncbi:hypothetical protein Psi02_77910 [Planotetraspora silvatica]|uniref:PknH-like extracellular domain-containing protein n=2 Tax=Planotetraspora silvatica TaxID=234614 RepID=A0A8J3XQX8_9ACTN|nr:hypothetical protein Psi02_77910 [Planotetraspora silvatica]